MEQIEDLDTSNFTTTKTIVFRFFSFAIKLRYEYASTFAVIDALFCSDGSVIPLFVFSSYIVLIVIIYGVFRVCFFLFFFFLSFLFTQTNNTELPINSNHTVYTVQFTMRVIKVQ